MHEYYHECNKAMEKHQPSAVAVRKHRTRYRHCIGNQKTRLLHFDQHLRAKNFQCRFTVKIQPISLRSFEDPATMSALDTDTLPIETNELEVPTLLEIQGGLFVCF